VFDKSVNSTDKLSENSSLHEEDINDDINSEHVGGSLISFIINPLGKYNPLNPMRNYFYEKMFGLVENAYKPNIHKAVSVVKITMPLVFAILTVNECCIVCKRP